MRKYIMSISSVIDSFSLMNVGQGITFEFKVSNSLPIFQKMENGDRVYVYQEDRIYMLLEICHKYSEDKIKFNKIFEIGNGVVLTDSELLENISSQIILEIDENKYIEIYSMMLKELQVCSTDEEADTSTIEKKEYLYESSINTGKNLVVYGTPGCGKSYYVKNELLKDYKEEHIIRTTFYQDYTNTDFVGQIMPCIIGDIVKYKFMPGPFALSLKEAISHPDKKIALVIEELNRGNASSIFGDIFQLLDRECGKSTYRITNVNLQNYLGEEYPKYKFNYIMIPSNLSIIATMNTSDQNVFTLDTAFKRRWDFFKLKNTFDNMVTGEHPYKNYFVPGMNKMTWENFVNSINEYVINSSMDLQIEDKQLGVFFVSKDILCENNEDSTNEKAERFAYKVLEYLWDDVAKFDRDAWFNDDIKTLDDLVARYVESGEEVFKDGVFKK